MIKICLAGVRGRMGQIIMEECVNFQDIEIISGFGTTTETVNKNIKIYSGQKNIKKACKDVDVWVDFTTPEVFLSNLPIIVKQHVDLVVGTTGWYEKFNDVRKIIKNSGVSAIISPNFSPLVNLQFHITGISSKTLTPFGYSFGIVEEHHEGKIDIPSGTADKLADIIMQYASYKEKKIRQRGVDKKISTQLDMASLRLKGTVGDHELRIRGKTARMDINTMIYTRQEFANGALYSIEWLSKNTKKGHIFDFYSDVLSFQ